MGYEWNSNGNIMEHQCYLALGYDLIEPEKQNACLIMFTRVINHDNSKTYIIKMELAVTIMGALKPKIFEASFQDGNPTTMSYEEYTHKVGPPRYICVGLSLQ